MDEKEFFDRLAPQWDANEIFSTPSRVERILGYMNLKPGMKVLDLGTGTGILLPYISAKIGPEGEITAVDYSEGMLSRAIEKYKNLTPRPLFLNIDFETETIPGEYDVIILYCVYPHLHTPEDTLKWLLKVNLKEGGKLFIAFPCEAEKINSIHKERHSESDKLPSAQELTRRFEEWGLKARTLCDEYVVEIQDLSR